MSPQVRKRARQQSSGLGEPGLWRECAALLDYLAPTVDVIGVTPVGSYLAWRLGGAVAAERLFLHAPEPDDQKIRHPGEAEPVILPGDQERDRMVLPRGLWPQPPASIAVRVRPLDLLYADSHKVGLMILDAADRTPLILRGAERVLTEHAPLLLLDCSAAAPEDRLRLKGACAATAPSYRWSTSPTCRGTVFRGVAAGRDIAKDAGSPLHRPSRLTGVPWRGALGRTAADPAPKVSLEFDDALPAAGMEPAERDHNGWRRRIRPGSRAAFYLPLSTPGRWHLRLRVADWGGMEPPASLRVYAGGCGLCPNDIAPDGVGFEPFNGSPRQGGALLIELITLAGGSRPFGPGIALAGCIAEPVIR